ncbi:MULTISPECIES: lipoprotein [Thiomicrorhabdus]|uniref:Lipoprotein n=1 Tax=Thiomicrorhabdus heinhorstiae TaxID=2748010 RepID=A0ABS0BU60_9GAMM|nr:MULTISPECIES: lipoprotein [Thiomicrorhabdus]MBF6057378.1 lipoprotein [Thiomicrorhabdus heinhorstiae]
MKKIILIALGAVVLSACASSQSVQKRFQLEGERRAVAEKAVFPKSGMVVLYLKSDATERKYKRMDFAY